MDKENLKFTILDDTVEITIEDDGDGYMVGTRVQNHPKLINHILDESMEQKDIETFGCENRKYAKEWLETILVQKNIMTNITKLEKQIHNNMIEGLSEFVSEIEKALIEGKEEYEEGENIFKELQSKIDILHNRINKEYQKNLDYFTKLLEQAKQELNKLQK
jgi:hypothetical protein